MKPSYVYIQPLRKAELTYYEWEDNKLVKRTVICGIDVAKEIVQTYEQENLK